jgi:acetyltransferase-like isoleucine patch superfamily enzyme
MLKSIIRGIALFGYSFFCKAGYFFTTIIFKLAVKDIGEGCSVCYPIYLKGSKYIKVGIKFRAGPGFRIEAWDEYLDIKHHPQIIIGNNVAVGFNVHIGAIGRMEIGNDVLIGSNVLITDHQHGRLTPEDEHILAIDRPLHSKGNVVIEDNVWIGEGACIMDGVRIGKNSVIGANAVVLKDIPQGSVAGGIPAKILRMIC